ncbi:LysE family transporter [Alkalihalobacillus sp. AL-G]|uniref:LysE family transporter n=1 Tax=Alkalihalobacillus sp. AL-G TaxID=2926399 RepID=UPI00272D1EBE|nr:LysE family transporter [Alkalihalobacillus sp. AL-G]WLD93797.1 LysE family transporter [Alkalihalobacillus sp. AL-G]
MDYLKILGVIVLIHILTMSIPGINFVAVTQTSIRLSKSKGIATALGIATGALIWSSSAAFGVGFLFEKYEWTYNALKWLGGAYIIYIGVKFWLSKEHQLKTIDQTIRSTSYFRSFLFGLITNLSNPKSVLFFGSIFTTVLHPGLPQWMRTAAVIVIFLNVVWWHTALALLFSRKVIQKAYIRNKMLMNRLAGSLFIIFGIQLFL